MDRSPKHENFALALVEACNRRVVSFEVRFRAKKNLIEQLAFDWTYGDPTFQRQRDILFRLPVKGLVALGVSPNMISIFGVGFAVLASFSTNSPMLFALLIFLNLLCDGLDGVSARYLKQESDFGSIFDITCDTVSLVVVSMGLALTGKLDLFLFLPYVVITLAYTYRSALKNKILDKVFQSIGSRVLAFSGLVLISLSLGANNVAAVHSLSVNMLFGAIFTILSCAYVIDVVGTRRK